ncbi:hypothetical protein EMIHUDRAFT_255100 [Emiliania huxleyi CCMP1516]|uniref:Uncharacterized protein n=2 Tax=Emiliania huxleyi TaxID=2903 RepID=A0A0D3JFZ9_EMIH1|nr:hypothetical protein EMIHUDRAFT_255100 [Emiliania huxleyi CCMP1516]EOD22434.1 hypothetical protein EMIHUDRAFT_255100 [Emiliania huxleyi CCMP1516]|eukprot:XP_005774863.1 hypothetical protein EMIHUDRAFT_255100 [Emiliania huxleyi CCMP1516]
MPAKKTGRGANLSLLNKEHPKDKKGDDDIGDLESVDKPDDSSSSGESTSGEALPLDDSYDTHSDHLPPSHVVAQVHSRFEHLYLHRWCWRWGPLRSFGCMHRS